MGMLRSHSILIINNNIDGGNLLLAGQLKVNDPQSPVEAVFTIQKK